MKYYMNKTFGTLIALTLGTSLNLIAETPTRSSSCAPTPPAPCYSVDTPPCDYCYGPENVAGNPAVRPYTCDGDFVFTIAGFYWNAHEDGLEYGIANHVFVPNPPTQPEIQSLNQLVNAKFLNPTFKWDFGWKLGAGYNSTRDGWDLNLLWTHYLGRAHSHENASPESGKVLITLWSDFASTNGSVDYAGTIKTHLKLNLNLVDLELGREFWNSKYLTLRPHIGLRLAYVDQKYTIIHRAGSWALRNVSAVQDPFNNEATLKNDFHGLGLRTGFDSTWFIGNGFSLFGSTAISLIYGRFSLEMNERNRASTAPFDITRIMGSDEHFHSLKAITDLTLGMQYSTLFNDCKYGFTLSLGWEHHLFLNQNQLWRVVRLGDTPNALTNNTGVNLFSKSRGDLSTQGWTLTARFDF